MTADGTNDDKIKVEGLNDYRVPTPMLLLDAANTEPSSNDIKPAEDEPDDVDFNNEDMLPTDDTSELEDGSRDLKKIKTLMAWNFFSTEFETLKLRDLIVA